jgi:hypothetical protein
MIENGLESDIFMGSRLVDMYAKCGSIEDVWRVFHKLPAGHVVVTGTATVLGHVNVGKGRSNVLYCSLVFFPLLEFLMLPHWGSSTRRFSHIWLWTSYESRNLVKSFCIFATCMKK